MTVHFDDNPTRLPGQTPAEAYRAAGKALVAEMIEPTPGFVVVELLRYDEPQAWGLHYLVPVLDGDAWSSRFPYRPAQPPQLFYEARAEEQWSLLMGFTPHKLADLKLDLLGDEWAPLVAFIGAQVIPLEWKRGWADEDDTILRRITVWTRDEAAA